MDLDRFDFALSELGHSAPLDHLNSISNTLVEGTYCVQNLIT